MSAEVVVEYIYSAWCASCAWGDGRISTTENEAEAMVAALNLEEHGIAGSAVEHHPVAQASRSDA